MEEDLVYERYLKEQEQLNSFETCRHCKMHVTEQEQAKQQITLLQSTECFHMIQIDPNTMIKITRTVNRKLIMLQRGFDSRPRCKKKISWITACRTPNPIAVHKRGCPLSSKPVTRKYVRNVKAKDKRKPITEGLKLLYQPWCVSIILRGSHQIDDNKNVDPDDINELPKHFQAS